jgi:hypothetical protein
MYRRKTIRRRLHWLVLAGLAIILLVPKFELSDLPVPTALLDTVWPGNALVRSAG